MITLFDFDGTVIDLWPRYHAVFCALLGLSISLNNYKTIKKELVRDELVARYFNKEVPDGYFEEKKMLLEQRDYLALDRLIFSDIELGKLFHKDAIILTKRRFPENLQWELDRFGINVKYECITTVTKEQWVNEHYTYKRITVVGDSIEDLRIGRNPNVSTLMVGYGLGSITQFDAEGIDYLYIETPQELVTQVQSVNVL